MFDASIYLTTMGFALALLPVFIVKVVYNYFGLEKSWKELTSSRWSILLIIAFILPVFWQFVPHVYREVRLVNFLQHGIGGGVAVTLGCLFMIQHFKDKLEFFHNRIFQIIFIFACVSMLGAVNEIFEFTFDALRIGIFSSDRYDTWYDIVANTTGGILAFLIYQFASWPQKIWQHFKK